jgi:hypothetical protein
VTAGGGLTFWLSYVESRGGLWERSGDTALVMVPPELQRGLDLPEEFAVTDHPDVAREDGVALLGAGHPLLLAAAEDVLSADDAGVLRLAAPAAVPPGDARLLERARETFPVDHGRIDASGPAERSLRQVLRVGAMVSYTASADDRFHERAECWVDVPSRHELPEQAVERMRRLATDGFPVDGAPDRGAVPPALAAAHRLLDRAAAERCRVLTDGSVRAAADAERARAETYYAEALASLARRQASAAPDRRALLAARADGVRAEEKRRLAEIDEKYTPRHEIRPYRLHLLYVPALRIPVDVLRGARRFPLTLEWLLPAAAFAPLRCPSCGADARTRPLVAAKTHLGCARCLSAGAVSPPPVPRASSVAASAVPARANGRGNGPPHGSAAGATGAAAGAAGAAAGSGRDRAKAAGGTVPAKRRPAASRPAHAASRPDASRRVSPAAGPKPLSPQAVSKTGGKLAVEFWSVTGQGNLRALRRLCAPDSPAAAAVRLYGVQGPATAIGMAAGDRPESLTSITSVPHANELAGTGGFLDAGRDRYNYLLRWDPCTRLVAEVLPFGSWVSARLPSARWLPGPASARLFGGLPEPDCDLDPVAVRLWRKVLPAHGLPLALRCLAAWWRISNRPELQAGPRPSVLAAAIHRMIGYRAGEAGVTHDAIAELHRVTADETRAITPPLQSRLQLSAQQPW